MRQWGFALGLVDVSNNGCLVFNVGLCIGLITIGLADLTQCDDRVVLDGRGVCLGMGWWFGTFPVCKKLTTASERFLMVVLAMASSIWALDSSSLSTSD